ncbi:hypothetical protein [Bacillus sp. T33-2]|uniref:hypothetical protein n=1 Tax=Bacillus sp. T33-2 TaxID=2054168 RepID=UPI000C789F94|nr:hypothetical protein [Bacillus sp. T33-2]PLR99554.1 hypothetical protein CVD19_00390 [Bacillus sp. T33-2]
MEEIKFLEIVFENVESIVIPIERVKNFNFGELTSMEHKHLEDNSYQTDHINLEITYEQKSELQYNPSDCDEPLGMFINNPTSNNVADRPNILGRVLNHMDIVDIQVLNENEEPIQVIYVPWHDEDQYDNRFMITKVEDGLVKIEIRRN